MKLKNTKRKPSGRSQIMTPKEAAKYLGLHPITVYRLIKKGQLPGFKLGGQWRFKKDLLDSWIASKINKDSEQKDGTASI
ncbi:MAG: helix-turn-helix domain-containing protein [Candidatus Omnitrophica bacterium]|nr:helix-turn-helix domain-containing protein [Candidatus Omnitrophota bacterium]MBU2250662.1 helix-turn-helix domain-containing protein [Candidatus Omnitrophota bacterium]MBU2266167.1 helix-turn-helix domain-containing protein [Candidatus Omnitrophota bacterium]MBU2473237.1 helix-turn-helix domain-containing protein [Candidatus Omnitrophota bacterium]